MARKTKHPKLPNGFGSIKYLGKGRTNPYAVHPPTTEFAPNGSPIIPKAIAYVPDWYTGFYVLQRYHDGTYTPDILKEIHVKDSDSQYDIVSKILGAYNNTTRTAKDNKKFSEVYEEFYNWKFGEGQVKKYSRSAKDSCRAAYKNCSALHDLPFKSLRTNDLQKVIDNCPLKHASKELIVSLLNQMYAYADMQDLCDKNYSVHVKINIPDDDEKGVPFTVEEIDKIWKAAKNENNEIYKCILIMIYSGFRIAAYSKKSFKIDLQGEYFQGGVKTTAGKDRIVPIHPLILNMIDKDLLLFRVTPVSFRDAFKTALKEIGVENHTPHDCRHTFSWLCDKYNVDPLSKKLLLGHALGNDITDSRYGHRTHEELRTAIEKIKHW